MGNKKNFRKAHRLVSLLVCLAFTLSIISLTTIAASSTVYVDGKIYEFAQDNDYLFSKSTDYKSTTNATTYGRFSIIGNESEISSIGKKNGVPAYSLVEGDILISYTYSDTLLNADNDDWHLVEDKEKNVDIYKLDNNVQKGAIILQRSKDHLNWSDISIQTNVFADTPIKNDAMYKTLDVELINGCYYRLIVVYELSRLADSTKVLGIFSNDKYEYKRVAEVYEFYAASNNEHIQNLGANTRTYRLGETKKVSDFESYSGSTEIKMDDLHYNWTLGDFFVSGFTSTEDKNGEVVFLKNVGDVVTLWFNLNQNIDALNNDPALSITADPDGHDQYFQTDTTNFGRGMLIIRQTNSQNIKSERIMYYDFLEANATLGANTRVQLFEEGDYEVALDYEVTKDQLVDKVEHYRIFFKFSVRNANSMFYLFDKKTNAELSNNAVTPNGFRLDLANSKYLKIYVEKEIWVEGADGLTKDTRFNTTAKDGDIFTDEGIYTITVENQYTGLKTEKTVYVGANRILMAYMTSNYSLSEIQDLVAKGATIYDDGTIEMPPATYTVIHQFISGTPGMDLPETVITLTPLNRANKEDGEEIFPGNISESEVIVEGGVWKFDGWDANGKVIDCADQVFIGTWVFISNAAPETDTSSESEANTAPQYEAETDVSSSETDPNTVHDEENSTENENQPKRSNIATPVVVVIIILLIGMSAFLLKKKSSKEEQK